MATKTRTARTPFQVTSQAPNLRTGRTEVWEAISTDGEWTYKREEDARTTWVVIHNPTDRWMFSSSLPKARAATADGTALAYLDALDAEKARNART